MKYVYTAVLTPSPEGFVATVPDVPGCTTGGADLTETAAMLKDALAGCLCVLEDEGEPIHPARLPSEIELMPGQYAVLVDVDTVAYRAATDNRAVRKNVSLPAWLHTKAEQAGVNYSQVLQEALRERLHLQ